MESNSTFPLGMNAAELTSTFKDSIFESRDGYLGWIGEICLQKKTSSSHGFNFLFGLKRVLFRTMIMQKNVISPPSQSQSKDFSQSMCRAGDKSQGCHGWNCNGLRGNR